ncbi:hypothetical protein ABI59_07445 [Acidobacteria bacterium Mor1]|nr:hypothetical protein ABI59_07445 [Acidobacteria bacterium Mor1]
MLVQRFTAFVAEACPFALQPAVAALESALRKAPLRERNRKSVLALIDPFEQAIRRQARPSAARNLPDATPTVPVAQRLDQAVDGLVEACEGFLRREAIAADLKPAEKRELLRGMILTRAVDNQLKAFFMGGDVRYGAASFQGKGFRSLGQEAVYGAALRLRRGKRYQDEDGGYRGDVVAPLIRDLGAALGMHPHEDTVFQTLNAQMGKAGPPMNGKDFHIGALEHGILPASAPLSISSMTAAGQALAFARRKEKRVAVAFIGEGGSSLGEWHEAINLCAARRFPAVFCIENNQTALSTPVHDQASVRLFADKAAGYGVPGITVDGTDPEAIAAAFGWAADRARSGKGPALIELIAMRMCGHAHHDDMLYLGHEPQPSWDYPKPKAQGYADKKRYAYWAERDPIKTYAAKLEAEGVIAAGDLEALKEECAAMVAAQTKRVIDQPWPEAEDAGRGVFADEAPRKHIEVLEDRSPLRSRPLPPLPDVEKAPAFDPKGNTFLEAVMMGVGDALAADDRTFVYGQDCGGKYGNAFLLLRPLLEKHSSQIWNSTLSEAGILGACTGAALAGLRPIGEIQFNDFVATGFNQLVNNAAKIRYRWGGSVPMVVRMPWGGLRKAGPYHSQNTEPWFYRTPGLKIVTPSTPHDARALMAAAVADPDPVLYYEHIGLYRDPRVKQKLSPKAPKPMKMGQAALRRSGSDLAIVSYGAYSHVAMRVAEKLAADGIQASVLDLRTLVPLDRETLLTVARHCGKILIVHEDSRTGGIGESLAAIIQEEAFEDLDAPVRVVGALDTPVPYSPPMEEAFLPSEARVEQAARLLAGY